ncbi:error-prone DNA polymerase [Simiduia sp. 21SJ11W-1]|uniref:error-prone DNA polymerase n=1 Tax=Simiduia sp. 21SJ11W-1 TaxID=2909669 RepID=UPI0020A21A49|nr:error-prone DNA polymerase [Simiduia sp. 21SJ11W-1]UTA46427.1 error-prone DNA polymerase [Simiduia sp. 21SJ11W-1]
MFAELHCVSNFTFLRGASRPEELVLRAHELGYQALAITDECSFAGVVKAHVAAQAVGLHLIIGSEFTLQDQACDLADIQLVLLAPNRTAYSEISALITRARRRASKGEYQLFLHDLQFGTQQCLAIFLPARLHSESQQQAQLARLQRYFKQRLWLGVALLGAGDDQQHYQRCYTLAARQGVSMVACNGVHMHAATRKPLQDVLSATRHNCTVVALGQRRQVNAERYLRPLERLAEIYPAPLLQESVHLASLCRFSMADLRYEYPPEVVPAGLSATQYLARLTYEGAQRRWPAGTTPAMEKQLAKELALIRELAYEYYFLTVYDLVRFARSRKILCQGRGSAANSAVCYCLGITEVDPAQSDLLFERFISKERNEPPDIDVDFEHERREEVIQYIYQKYTRERAALAATVITYRPKSAVRDVGRALGLDVLLLEKISSNLSWWDKPAQILARLQEAGLPAEGQVIQQFVSLVHAILGFPRHLSQHVGGFLITKSPVSTLVPVENAAMAERTVIQWDKEDIEALGLLKVDVLALGMLTAIRKTLALINSYQTPAIGMGDIPKEDPKTYAMLCRGDSVGVFQVESRAQMAMLPRLKPRTFYDLVIQVAIVRPGPIQGDMVHPYLRRRNGEEAVTYPSDAIKGVLARTLGVPIFQEQVIKLAMVAAGFSGGEADQLRRAMASWGRNGNLYGFRDKLMNGMAARGHSVEFVERLFRQMQGFGEYGFPESHAASFALLVYVSAWLKCHYPAAFYCGLLNSLPMGFYSPSQLVQDARRHQVAVLPLDVRASSWDHTLENLKARAALEAQPSLRLGLRLVKGLRADTVARCVAARERAPFRSLKDLQQRAQLSTAELEQLAACGALSAFQADRYRAQWAVLDLDQPPLFDVPDHTPTPAADEALAETAKLPAANSYSTLVLDYQTHALTLGEHPISLLRKEPRFKGCKSAQALLATPHGRFVRALGLVTGRQRPGTASGVLFMTLEDETGNTNVVVWQSLQERCRRAILKGRLLLVKGVVEREGRVVHLIAGHIEDCSSLMPELLLSSRDFH